MPFVLDASIAHAWAFKEISETADIAQARLEADTAWVPSLWWFELRNGLVMAERRGRITEQETAQFLRRVANFAPIIDPLPDEAAVMTLARRHRLTVYDAAYLELALREGVPLATLDGPLTDAARAEGVELIGG